jgi:hypothetical protein
LHPYHIWTDDWLTERLAWKPERPAYALLLRTYRFQAPVELVYQASYQGCRSWITLEPPVTLPASEPVLDTATYAARVAQIQAALEAVTADSLS